MDQSRRSDMDIARRPARAGIDAADAAMPADGPVPGAVVIKERLTADDRWTLAAILGGIGAAAAALSLSLPLLAFVLDNREVGSEWIGLNTAMAGIGTLVINPFIPRLAQTFGTARLLIASVLVMLVTLNAFYVIEAFWAWFPLRLLFAAAITVIFVLTEFWINTIAPDRTRGSVIGLYTTVLATGIATGPVILAITGSQGYEPFLWGSIVLVVAALPIAFARRRAPVLPRGPSVRVTKYVLAVPVAMLASAVFGAVESGGAALLPVYGQLVGFSERQATILVGAVALGGILFQIPIGRLADRIERRRLMLACGLFGVAGMLLAPAASSAFWAIAGLLFVTGGIVAGLYTVGLVHVGSRFTGMELAAANSAFVMMYAVGMIVGPAALGFSLDHFPPHGLTYGICAFFALFCVIVLARILARGGTGTAGD